MIVFSEIKRCQLPHSTQLFNDRKGTASSLFFFLRGEEKQSQENEKVSFYFRERLCAERRFPRSAHRCAAPPLFFFSLRYGSIGRRLAHYLTRGVYIQLAKHPLCGHLRSKTKSNVNCWALKIQDSNIIKSLQFYSTLAIL